MPRICEQDPNLEVCPEFTSACYLVLRERLIAADTHATVAVLLKESWTQENNARKVAFTQQKRQRFGDIDLSKPVPDYISPPPSSFAIEKLDKGEYVELYYFTKEGIEEANNRNMGMGIKNDNELTWEQYDHAWLILYQRVMIAGWPEAHVSSLLHFFSEINSHRYRARLPYGPRALLMYQATVRRAWHDELARGRGFNISLINEKLLGSIYSDIIWGEQAEAVREVEATSYSPGPPRTRAGSYHRQSSRSRSPAGSSFGPVRDQYSVSPAPSRKRARRRPRYGY
ncbi:hypothetical protein EW146_g9122 [Bondarzewia mesenterica]|uniref:Uncharacterized protein n=1 Tax=Bondarzewia mesenterica TaxID=1095465 RepID=A0A4S4L988_9AGAM|nr:hypothetical protein EW146_g9122 [Bondarzewia mesenterica]